MTVYLSFSGREEDLDGLNGEGRHKSLISIGIDCRCENLAKNKILKGIRLSQPAVPCDGSVSQPTLLVASLKQRSKRIHAVVHESTSVTLEVSYTKFMKRVSVKQS